ncbi:unnamed protein product [Alopecurus aequalis]
MPPTATSLTLSRWADLPPDLLGDISGHLRDPADFTRVHAVCTLWRDALLSRRTTAASSPPFLPWLLTSSKGRIFHCTVDFGRIDSAEVSSMSSHRRSREDVILVEPAGATFVGDGDRNWVTSADGTAAWLFTDTRPLNVLTGVITRLPKLQDLHHPTLKLPMENLCGIVYGDGTIFLYSIIYKFGRLEFTAAILRPNNAAWTFVNRTLLASRSCQPAASYHNGKILVFPCAQDYWYVLAPDDSSPDGYRLEYMFDYSWSANHGRTKYLRDYSYILASQGELLWVSVLVKQDNRGGNGNTNDDDPVLAFSVTVHALEEEEEEVSGGGKMRWVARDGRTFVDRILFLGAPASIVVDDAQLAVGGGCAYFVFKRGLFRYSFVDGEAKLVKQLRPVHGTDKACVWLQPQPTIAPIDEIRERIEVPKMKKPKLYQFGKSDSDA